MSKLPGQEPFESLLQSAASVLAREQEQQADLLFTQSQQEEAHLFSEEFDERILRMASEKEKKILFFPKKAFLKYAACFALVTVLCGSFTMMDTSALRSQIYKFFYEDKQEYTQIDLVPDGNESYAFHGKHEKVDYRYPTYLPPGYRLINREEYTNTLMLQYEDNNENFLLLTEDQVMGSVMSICIDTEDAEIVETLTIGDMEGMYVYKNGSSSLLFHDDELSIYLFGQKMDKEEIMKIANGLV